MKKVLCTFLLGFFVPGFVFAATTYHINLCANFTLDTHITCTGAGQLTWTTSNFEAAMTDGATPVDLGSNNSTWYLSFGHNVTGGTLKVRLSGNVNDGTLLTYTTVGTTTADSLGTNGTGNTHDYLRIGGPAAWIGSVNDICITDTSGDCEAGGGGGGGGYDPTATSTQDQTQRNLFNGWIIYFASMFGMIWLLRKR